MTREQAKKNLIAFGIEEPTEDQISNYLNQLNDETKQYKDKAKKVDDLQKQLDDLNNQGMSELEKANKAIEDSNKTIAELTKQVNTSEVKAILANGGLSEEDYKDFIGGIVTDNLETSKTLAANLVSVFAKQRTATEAKLKEELLKGTPGGNSGNGGSGGNQKTQAELFAESLGKSSGETVKQTSTVLGNYVN